MHPTMHHTINESLHYAMTSLEVLAVLAFACSGLIAGLRKQLDLVGICMVSGATAFGGGTLRDILLDRRPFFWIENAYWLWIILLLCLIATIFMKRRHVELTERAIQVPDAIGLGLFSVVGAQMALDLRMPIIVTLLMAVLSAIFGGVLRDMICNEIPKALSDHQPYAIFAFLGSALMIALQHLGMSEWLSLSLCAALIALLRIVAVYQRWELPRWQG